MPVLLSLASGIWKRFYYFWRDNLSPKIKVRALSARVRSALKAPAKAPSPPSTTPYAPLDYAEHAGCRGCLGTARKLIIFRLEDPTKIS